MSTQPDPIAQFFIDLESWYKESVAKFQTWLKSLGFTTDQAEEAKTNQGGENPQTSEPAPEVTPTPPKAKVEDRPEVPPEAKPAKETKPRQRTYPDDPKRRGSR